MTTPNPYIRTLQDYAIEMATDYFDEMTENDKQDFLMTVSNSEAIIDLVWSVISREIDDGCLKDIILAELMDRRDEIYQKVKEHVKDALS
ncbi:hypothetical protein EBZ39_16570 [bacterium]|nr:hypothetical protein [bacterium]